MPYNNFKQIAFIDASITDHQHLMTELAPIMDVVLIQPGDGLKQIALALDGRQNTDALHLYSHGAPGRLQLGGETLTADSLTDHGHTLTAIGQALSPEADILLYGCYIAAGATGAAFIAALSAATGADVAASDDMTGAAAPGGDWDMCPVPSDYCRGGTNLSF